MRQRAAGGLKIIGTERHESRRIDNQLRGRSGRQGDPGESRFYISLEDDLMRLFGSERLMSMFKAIGVARERADRAQDAFQCNRESTDEDRRATTTVSVKTCWSTTRSTTSSVKSFTKSVAVFWTERVCVMSIFKMITDIVDNTVDMCISDDQDTAETGIFRN